MRFTFYTDVHLSGKTPRHRVDDFQEALLGKLREVYSEAESNESEFVVCGGDLFNSHRIYSYELLAEVIDILCGSKLPTYMTIGQHDLIGYNRDTYRSSTLAFVVELCPNLHVLWKPTMIGNVQLVASHVWEDPLVDPANQVLDNSAFNVLIAHHLLTNKKTLFDVVNTSDFAKAMREKGANYDLVLSGDLHDGYAVHEDDGMWFCNPGSLARQAISDQRRKPKYVIIDADPGEHPVIDVRDIKCARPGEEVFGESASEIMHERSDFDPNAFIQEVEEFEAESADVYELVRKIGSVKGIRPEVLEYIEEKKPQENE
jgi:DNA repair exonuclease SbcCD nuclease subunit